MVEADRRRALVMGGSKGLGRAVARGLVDAGRDVAICARSPGPLAATAAELGATGFMADLSQPDAGARLVAEVAEKFGAIDILVVNTGGPPPGRFEEIDDGGWRRGFESLWMSAVQPIRACLPHMRGQGWGRILLITSIAAREPLPGLMLSNSFRAGLHGMVNGLSREVAGAGITVNAIMPGYMLTERLVAAGFDEKAAAARIPAGRVGRPEEFAALAVFLASEQAGYITGQAIACDGGALNGI